MQPVLSITSEQLNGLIVSFLWPFVRMLALISSAPIFGEKTVPRSIKVGMAVLLSIVVAPTLREMPLVPPFSVAGVWILIQQILIGLAMGFSMKLVFSMVQAAGEYIGLQMGLSFASFFDPTSGGNTMVIARFLNTIAMLIFLATDLHLMLIQTLAESFSVLPISDAPLAAGGWYTLVLTGGQIFSGGLMLALPIITILLSINLAMGVLNRASPQFSIFAVGFPITLLTGIFMIQALMQYTVPFLEPRFISSFSSVLNFLNELKN
jgi:flagellar biosynthetic protein FliR